MALAPDWFEYFSEASKEALPLRAEQMNQRLATIESRLEPSSPVNALIDQVRAQISGYAHSATDEHPPAEPTFIPPQSLDLIIALQLTRQRDMLRNEYTLTALEIKKKQSQVSALKDKLADIRAQYQSLSIADPDRLKIGLEIIQNRLTEATDSQYLKHLIRLHKDKAHKIATMTDFLADQAVSRLAYSAKVDQSWSAEKKGLSAQRDALTQAPPKGAFSRAPNHLGRLNQLFDQTRLTFLNARIALLTEGLALNHDLGNTARIAPHRVLERLDALHDQQKDWARQLARWQDDLALQRNLIRTLGQDPGIDKTTSTPTNKTALLQQVATIQNDLDQLSATLFDIDALADIENQWITLHQGLWARWLGELRQQVSSWRVNLGTLFTASLFQINDTPVTVVGLLRVLFILIVAWWISKGLRNGLTRVTAKRPGFNPSSVYTLGKVLHYAIITFGLMFALSSIGLDLSKFALLVSALGVGIGFGLQTLVSNFVSGLILLFERSLKIGDYVELQSGVSGEVRQINIRSTLVTTNDNIDIVIPNSEFVNGRVINWTMHEAARRVHIPFGVAYGTDKDLVRSVVIEAAREVPFTLDQPGREPQVWLVNFGDSSLNFELVLWLTQEGVKKPGLVNASYLWTIESALTKNHIEIPFPQRDVHIRSMVARDQWGQSH